MHNASASEDVMPAPKGKGFRNTALCAARDMIRSSIPNQTGRHRDSMVQHPPPGEQCQVIAVRQSGHKHKPSHQLGLRHIDGPYPPRKDVLPSTTSIRATVLCQNQAPSTLARSTTRITALSSALNIPAIALFRAEWPVKGEPS